MLLRISDGSCELAVSVSRHLLGKMQDQEKTAFVDMLEERRKDWDFLWAIRPMKPLLPHKLPPESKYTRKQTIEYILSEVTEVKHRIEELAETEGISIKDAEKKARVILNEIASEEDLTTVRMLGKYIYIFLFIYNL